MFVISPLPILRLDEIFLHPEAEERGKGGKEPRERLMAAGTLPCTNDAPSMLKYVLEQFRADWRTRC